MNMFCERCGRHDIVQVTWFEETEEYLCIKCLIEMRKIFYGEDKEGCE